MCGVVLALGAGLVILGGIKRIASFTSKLVPLMSVLYFLMTITIVILNAGRLPAAFGTIFEGAFSLEAAGGGALGYVMMLALRYGFSRGVFSNEMCIRDSLSPAYFSTLLYPQNTTALHL